MFYESENLQFIRHESEVPWVKIFTKEEHKELSDVPFMVRAELFEAAMVVERSMIEFFAPTKINIASFGNMLPRVHLHVMARFENDAYFPEPMWGIQQRENTLQIESFEEYLKVLAPALDELFL